MNLSHRILTILLIVFGVILLTLSLWLAITFPNNIFMGFSLGAIGLIATDSGLILRKVRSVKEFVQESLSSGLIAIGIGLVVISLWLQLLNQINTAIICGLIGLGISTLGWLLQKSKLSLIRNIISALLITTGVSLFILPVIILTVYGTNVSFVNISLSYFIFGLLISLIGLSMRQKKS